MTTPEKPILVLAGTGKAGRHVVSHLRHRGYNVRVASRQSSIPFHWDNPRTWADALDGIDTVFAAMPDFVVPIQEFIELAESSGIKRLVGLAGRGGPEVQGAPFNELSKAVRNTNVDWTLLEPTNFNENFSEGIYREAVLQGEIVLPLGDTQDPYVALDDVGAVAAEVVTQPGHTGMTYELTGPEALSLDHTCLLLSRYLDTPVRYRALDPAEYDSLVQSDPELSDIAEFLINMYAVFRQGRYSDPTDHVQKILGRPPLEFSEWARRTALTGAWKQI